MVKEQIKNSKKLYQCEECKLCYENPKTAEKCEAWCREHQSCNLEIIKGAVIRARAKHYSRLWLLWASHKKRALNLIRLRSVSF